tara:strand:+ start:802 stop:1056 length:255 start_codon:yes stop_codon:yes gene_type:complete
MFKTIKIIEEKKISNYHPLIYITDENNFTYTAYTLVDFREFFNKEQFIDDESDRYKMHLERNVAKEYIENRELKADTERKQYVN